MDVSNCEELYHVDELDDMFALEDIIDTVAYEHDRNALRTVSRFAIIFPLQSFMCIVLIG